MGENKDTAKALKLVINYGRFVFEETKNIRCQNMPFFCLPPLISIAPLGLKKVKAGLHKPSIYVAMTFMETCWNKYSIMNKITLLDTVGPGNDSVSVITCVILGIDCASLELSIFIYKGKEYCIHILKN